MRALQMTQNKGAPQGWVQDGMSAERELKDRKSSMAALPVTIDNQKGHRVDSCSCCRSFQSSSTSSIIWRVGYRAFARIQMNIRFLVWTMKHTRSLKNTVPKVDTCDIICDVIMYFFKLVPDCPSIQISLTRNLRWPSSYTITATRTPPSWKVLGFLGGSHSVHDVLAYAGRLRLWRLHVFCNQRVPRPYLWLRGTFFVSVLGFVMVVGTESLAISSLPGDVSQCFMHDSV